MSQAEEYAKKIDVFANEIHNFAEYIRENPNDESFYRIQTMYLEFLPLEIELLADIKERFPKLFSYMIKDE
jgi:hypothetical protein